MFSALIAGTALALLSACSPPKAPETAPAATEQAIATEADAATRNAVLAALTPAIEGDLGTKVSFRPEIVRTMGDWAWVSAEAVNLDGTLIDISRTRYANAEKEGVFDGPRVNALLKRSGAGWAVTTFVVGSTDVAWEVWPQQYGAPPEVMGFETAEGDDN
jgi:hypothetical protein